ncbi:MAG: hypothetical protein RMY36_003305 [Nostoc sp. SerVER01]|nr:hypothetical protein [Nostoc sp. SerVER01]
MTQEKQIRNPTITLYPFHLREDFDEGFDEKGRLKVAQNAKQLWENLTTVGEHFDITELKSLRDYLLCYNNGEYNHAVENTQLSDQDLKKPDGKTLRFQSVPQPDNLTVGGSIYPLRIHDTYAADLTLSYKSITEKEKSEGITVKVADLSKFNPQGCLLPDKIQPSIGQTLLLYGEPVNLLDKDYRDFADACVQRFVQDKVEQEFKFRKKGRLFGSPIFEYDNGELNPAKRCHIIVWLKRVPETLSKLATTNFNYYLLKLLCYRSKTIFAYYKSKQLHKEAQILVSKLEKEIPEFEEIEEIIEAEIRIQRLKNLLARIRANLFDYTKCLRYLRECHNTVSINTDNYAEVFAEIHKLRLEGDNLELWQDFIDLSHNKFQSQIQVDLNYLIANQDLFKEMIDTIRGMVEILAEEQAQVRDNYEKERDRNLQINIGAVGVGLGFAGVVVSSSPYLPLKPPFTSSSFYPFISVLSLSLICGFVSALLTRVVVMRILTHRDNKRLHQSSTPIMGELTQAKKNNESHRTSQQK